MLVRYPSRTAFLKMVTSPKGHAQANVHRENGVDDHVILASTETYSKFSPPKTKRRKSDTWLVVSSRQRRPKRFAATG